MDNINRDKRDTAPCIPGKKATTKLTNNENKTHTVFSIMDSLNQGTANIEYSNEPNITLLLGLSGAGKSTLAQYLFGDNSNLISVAKRNIKCQKTGDFYIEDPGKKIGHNALLSHTELPDLLINPETNTTIYDCPGFSDTRDPEHDISGAYFIKAVSNKAKALKFIFVVNYNSITTGANREEFMTLARHATNLINNIWKYNDSIALVATKIKDNKSDEQRIIAITDFLQDVRQTLIDTNKEPNVQLFIDILLTASGPDNQNYTKIGLMPNFDTEGRLIDLPAVQAHKKSLLTIIHNNIKFTKVDAIDLKPTISSNSASYIDGLVNEVTQRMSSDINNVVQSAQVFYDDLIQNMLDTIHSFSNEETVVDQSKAELFLSALNTGLSVVSKVIKNTKNKTTFIELSKYIISSAMISEVNLSQSIISNFSTQHEYLQFLLSVHEPKDSFNVNSVLTLFTNLENQLTVSINRFRKNVTDVTDKIKNMILVIDNNIMNQIENNFTSITETIFDNTQISSLMNRGRLELTEIRNLANSQNITYKCIHQIQKTIRHFNFTDTNIKSANYIIHNTSKLVSQLNFLQTFKDKSFDSNQIKCTDGINRVISHLNDLSKWYGFLNRIFEKLSEYTVQKDIAACYNLSESIMSHKAPVRAADIIPRLFVERCLSVNEYNTADIDNVVLDEIKLDALKRIINHTLNYNSSYSCDLKSPDHLVIKGHYIKISDLDNCPQIKEVRHLEIFALKKIFIDADFDKTGKNFSLCIIAPIWEIYGAHQIKLDGKPGDTQPKADNGINTSISLAKDGNLGLPGGPGGNFLGVGANFIGSHDLSISVDGGSGGPGQEGGDGSPGRDDTECPSTIKDELYLHKYDCLSFQPKLKGNFYVDGCTRTSTFDGFSLNIWVNTSKHQVVDCYPKNDWIFKGNGADGANGGKGGAGGYAGNITVISRYNQFINLRNQTGKIGSDGKGGVGGKTGKPGKILNIDMHRVMVHIGSFGGDLKITVDLPSKDRLVASKKSYFPGKSGTDGYSSKNRKDPEKPLSHLHIAHQSIDDYKTFFKQYLSDNTNSGIFISFLDLLEKF